MTKNFFEYVKELVPEKGAAFFTFDTHISCNALSLYQLADLFQGKKISSRIPMFEHVTGVTGYSWNVERMFKYDFETVGIFLAFDNGDEKWIHFSKDAFIGAVCLVANLTDTVFDDEEHEAIRQAWTEKNTEIIKEDQSNFNEEWFAYNLVHKKPGKIARKDRKPVTIKKALN